ncbi:competence/damage-inducible protein A [Metabacillus iocasae]|uniref:Putative competence-damage inducible protein n=1 Tax=Priestia iocasae TaxID=2291674 RepID=A0ABS2QSJ6_9BACI|nr:competence/damage-inducible protein A [Metabacillus iocasae]MBM7701937.1 nicotinamide-nucleotide amidase [Metabacillus iocasae]
MNAEIIGVGSELLLGQIANTNAQYLSKQLAEIGINVYYHTVVGDNANRLKDAIHTAQKRANLIIFTGGLGPTKDDLTKEAISQLLGKPLVTDEEALQSIELYFKKVKRVMTPNNKKQALVMEGSTILRNDYGMAPGMAIKVEEIEYMLFPGPPKELYPMYENYAKEYLLNKLEVKERIESRVLRFFGIGESQLETEIEDLLENQTNPTIAPLAGDGEVTLRLTAKHADSNIAQQMIDEVEQVIRQRVGPYFYGYNQTSLQEELMSALISKGKTIASAESLTGGLFSERLTSLSGAGAVLKGSIVCYHNEIKQHTLGVSSDTLHNYGAVSTQCAKEMAEQIRVKCSSDVGISFTGVAGPKVQEGKEVGTVFVGISVAGRETTVHHLQLTGSRQAIRQRTVRYGCHYLLKALNEEN